MTTASEQLAVAIKAAEKTMRKRFFSYTHVALISIFLTVCMHSSHKNYYADVEQYLVGENIEDVVKRYGNPQKTNQIGNTIFVSYQGIGTISSGFSNICFLELQSDVTTKKITSVKLGSNLSINRVENVIHVRNDCNRVFSR